MDPTTNPRPVMDIRPHRPAPPPMSRPDFGVSPVPAPQPIVPSPSPIIPGLPQDHHEVHPTPAIFPADLPKVKTPRAAIAMAVMVGLTLIGVTVFGYMKSQDKDEMAKTPATVEAAVPKHVDDLLTATDTTLEALDDAEAFSANELSDDSLGL